MAAYFWRELSGFKQKKTTLKITINYTKTKIYKKKKKAGTIT